MTGDERPQAPGVGPVGCALVHDEPGAEQEGAADRPRTHHPAEVGEPAQGVARAQVERVGEVLGGLDREAAVDVDRPLRLAGRARGVDHHVRRLGVGRGTASTAGSPCAADAPVPAVGAGSGAQSTSRPGRSVVSRAARPRRRTTTTVRTPGASSTASSAIALSATIVAAAEEAVGGDQVGRLECGQPGGDRRGREAAEDRSEDRPEPAEGEDRDRRLGEHRQEDPDPGPLPHPGRGETAGGIADLAIELGPGEGPDRSVLALPGQCRVVGSGRDPRFCRRDRMVERATDPPAGPSRAHRPGPERSWGGAARRARDRRRRDSRTSRGPRPLVIGSPPAQPTHRDRTPRHGRAELHGSPPGPWAKAARGRRFPVGQKPPVTLSRREAYWTSPWDP